ncbi:RNA methyltransferase [Urechidicola sp. KH5]
MLSKSQIKLIKSLYQKKYRVKNSLFLVEGIKGVNEFLNSSFQLENLFATEQYLQSYNGTKGEIITDEELKKVSQLKSPNEVLAIFKIPEKSTIDLNTFSVVLDGINDPGNLGTIIRMCDWFGVEQLICSKDTVDCFNAKVVQATMGSLARVRIVYADLMSFLDKTELPSYVTIMDGKNVYASQLPEKANLIMGNEAHGVSSEILEKIEKSLTIPQFGLGKTESLNVATATAILLSEFKRS